MKRRADLSAICEKRETSRGKPGETSGEHGRARGSVESRVSPFFVAESPAVRRSERRSIPPLARPDSREILWEIESGHAVIRGFAPCVRLRAYARFTSGLPRNYHCGNSVEPGRLEVGKGKNRRERWERERKRGGGGGENAKVYARRREGR